MELFFCPAEKNPEKTFFFSKILGGNWYGSVYYIKVCA
jgi:hypothetical protein